MQFQPNWTVQQTALEVTRVAHEGLGNTHFEQLRAAFNQEVQKGNSDQEIRLRAVTRMLIKLTDRRTGPKVTAETRIAGLCLLWLATTRVRDWTVLQLYHWMLPFIEEA